MQSAVACRRPSRKTRRLRPERCGGKARGTLASEQNCAVIIRQTKGNEIGLDRNKYARAIHLEYAPSRIGSFGRRRTFSPPIRAAIAISDPEIACGAVEPLSRTDGRAALVFTGIGVGQGLAVLLERV